MPRRYRGKDSIWWYFTLGDADTTVDQRRGVEPPRLITGVRGGHDVDLRRLAADG
jgi:putative flavoprotein involved in K+ transport